MPINNGRVFCINHPDIPMVRNTGFSAVTKVDTTGINFAFNPATGVPLVVYYCNNCGYVELYAAQKTSYWNEEKFGSTSAERAEIFEELVAEALRTQITPFGLGTVSKNVRMLYQGRTFEIDIVVETEKAVFLVEVKAKASRSALLEAVNQVVQAANIYYLNKIEETNVPVFPVIVIPAEPKMPDVINSIPVLKFDSDAKIFTNSEEVIKRLKEHSGIKFS